MAFLPTNHLEHVNRSERTYFGLDLHYCPDAAGLIGHELEVDGVFHPVRVVRQLGDRLPHHLLGLFDLLCNLDLSQRGLLDSPRLCDN